MVNPVPSFSRATAARRGEGYLYGIKAKCGRLNVFTATARDVQLEIDAHEEATSQMCEVADLF